MVHESTIHTIDISSMGNSPPATGSTIKETTTTASSGVKKEAEQDAAAAAHSRNQNRNKNDIQNQNKKKSTKQDVVDDNLPSKAIVQKKVSTDDTVGSGEAKDAEGKCVGEGAVVGNERSLVVSTLRYNIQVSCCKQKTNVTKRST